MKGPYLCGEVVCGWQKHFSLLQLVNLKVVIFKHQWDVRWNWMPPHHYTHTHTTTTTTHAHTHSARLPDLCVSQGSKAAVADCISQWPQSTAAKGDTKAKRGVGERLWGETGRLEASPSWGRVCKRQRGITARIQTCMNACIWGRL